MQRSIRSIQILRGFAAWAVVAHHFTQVFYDFQVENPVAKLFAYHGLLGVDVFFVISGFVMHHAIRTRPRGAWEFAAGRIARILPAYWIATFAIVAATAAGLLVPGYPYALWDWTTLFYSLAWVPHEHLSGLGVFPVLTVGWTLNFEMFFYALLAICIGLFGRHAIAAAAVVLILLPLVAQPDWPWGPVIASPLLYEFLVGMALSAIWRRAPTGASAPVLRIALASAGLGLAIATFRGEGVMFSATAATGIVIAALAADTFLDHFPASLRRGLDWAGATSYSAYVWHPVVLFLLFSVSGAPSGTGDAMLLLSASLVGTAFMADIGYRFIERPMGRRLTAALS